MRYCFCEISSNFLESSALSISFNDVLSSIDENFKNCSSIIPEGELGLTESFSNSNKYLIFNLSPSQMNETT